MGTSIFQRLVLAKIEAVSGTDSVPAPATDAIRVSKISVKPTTAMVEYKAVKDTMGDLPHLIGKQEITCELTCYVHGSGALGTAPELSPLWQACGLAETITAGTSVAYNPLTTGIKTTTIYIYMDGLLWKLVGAAGTCKITAEIGKPVEAVFSFHAKYTAPTVVAVPAGAVFQSTEPIVGTASDVVDEAGTAVLVGKLDLDLGNDVQPLYTTGQDEYLIANRKPKVNFTKDSAGTTADWDALVAATDAIISGTYGVAGGNQLVVGAPVGRRTGITYGEHADRDTHDVAYDLYESAGDDQYSLTFQ